MAAVPTCHKKASAGTGVGLFHTSTARPYRPLWCSCFGALCFGGGLDLCCCGGGLDWCCGAGWEVFSRGGFGAVLPCCWYVGLAALLRRRTRLMLLRRRTRLVLRRRMGSILPRRIRRRTTVLLVRRVGRRSPVLVACRALVLRAVL